MNKKGDFTMIGITIISLMFITLFIFQDNLAEKEGGTHYVGDNSTKIVYNIRSKNPDCRFENILIGKENLVFFDTLEEAENYTLDEKCN